MEHAHTFLKIVNSSMLIIPPVQMLTPLKELCKARVYIMSSLVDQILPGAPMKWRSHVLIFAKTTRYRQITKSKFPTTSLRYSLKIL